jgi:MFS transporter, DHA3 family, macrolide efflux protein
MQRFGLRKMWRSLFYRQGTNIFTVLRVHDFRNLWIGQSVSLIGDSLAINTLTLSIIQMANEEGVKYGGMLGALYVFSALAPLLLGMVAGTIVDRANRKTTMIISDVVRGFLALGFLVVHSLDYVWVYIVVSVAVRAVSTFFMPARMAMLPHILPDEEQLIAGNALTQLTMSLSFVVGASVSGVLVGLADATAPAFIFDSLSFFVSAAFIARISTSGTVRAGAVREAAGTVRRTLREKTGELAQTVREVLGELKEGLHYVMTDQVMRGVLISFLALFLGLGAANVTFVPLLIDELNMPEEGLGLVRFSQTVGIIIGSAIVASIATRYKARDLIGLSMVIFGVMTLVVSVVGSYALMVAVLFLVGLSLAPPQIVAPTLMQNHVPDEKLGRAAGAQGTIVNVANIASMAAAGYLMEGIGARMVFAISGALIFSAGWVSWWVLRDVADKPAAKTEPEPAEAVEDAVAAEALATGDPVPEA